jgi:uncharacterized protein YraI
MTWKQTLGGTAAVLLLSVGAAAAYPATVTGNLNMRSGPGTGYPVLDTLPPGTVVDVRGCSGSWCDVGSGWVSASYLAQGGYAAPPPVAAAPVVSFYIGSDPYYWDDGGYYYYVRSGRRHRVDNYWISRHHSNVRWHNNRDRDRFDRWRGRDRHDGNRNSGHNDRGKDHGKDRGKNHSSSQHRDKDRPRASSNNRGAQGSFVGAKSGAKQKRLER